VNSPASVGGDDRIRLFIGLRLPESALDRLVEWQEKVFPPSDVYRVLPRESLHVTLAFLGHRLRGEVDAIAGALRQSAASAGPPVLTPVRYRETRSVGMLVCSDDGERATGLARDLHGLLEELGVYEPEKRPWLPHLTVLRFRRGRPRLSPELPALGSFSPSDAAVYHSVLRRGGAQYVILESAELRGG
jgi:RNA 2',3'-cyclic 3'-phosphodiesterase